MFKSGRWKSNNRIKVMFQLQFQATQVPKLKGKGLMVALIPADIGKPIAKLEKVPIVDGTCTWADPVYELVKLVKNQKTETYKEKIYYFNVQTGSSKSGFVGEVGVDFANFVESNEPFQLSLPLTTSESGAVLHVFIQKMQRTEEHRENEENESLQSESLRSKKTSDGSENGNNLDFADDEHLSRVDSWNNSDPKLENNPNFKEHATVKKNSKPINKKVDRQRSSNDWSLGSLSDRSMTDLLNSPERNCQNQTDGYTEASTNAVEVLKSDVSRLERQAELSEMQLEALRKQLLKENKRGQDLLRKIDILREEKEDLKTECDELKSSQNSNNDAVLLEEIREELRHEKSLNKSLTLNLRKTEESNSELLLQVKELEGLHAEIEVERKEKEELKIHMEDISLDYKFLLQENYDLSLKLEETQIEQMKMQSEYSKSLTTIKQYELQVKRLEEKIVNQAMEHSQSLDTITELETHIKSLENELEKQGLDFEEDVEDLMKAKIEQEERVTQAEEALRKSELTNATAVENLQEALQKLSLTKDTHKQKVQKLIDQIDQQEEQIKQMSLELETSKKHEENNGDLNKWIRERDLLVTEFDSLKKGSTSWTSLMSEKNVMIRTLQSELKMLRGNNNGLQQRLSVIESEKVNLQKEVSRLEQKHLNLLKESKVACAAAANKHDESRSISESAKSNEGRCSEKDLSKRTSYHDEQKLNELLSQISSLDERNKHMEIELKEMEEKYSGISLRFAEVEGERQQLVMTVRNLRNGKKI